tara:strand:+ start:3393 stop:4340 length:948 start_codon:yes stop_codon:yes gene_type:complete
MTAENEFLFEQNEGPDHDRRSNDNAEPEAKFLATRLGVQYDALSESHRKLLVDYAREVLLPIDWYVNQIKLEEQKQRIFKNLTLASLIGIPLVAFFGPPVVAQFTGFDPTLVGAQISAIVASVVAGHRGATAWMRTRNNIGGFWQAAAELKSSIYSIIDTHEAGIIRETVNTPATLLSPDLTQDLKSGIVNAQATIKTETQSFFDNFKAPDIKLGATLRDSIAAGSKVSGDMLDPRFTSETKDLHRQNTLERNIKAAEIRLKALRKNFDRWREELQNSGSKDAALKTIVTKAASELSRVESQLEKDRAELAAIVQ